MSVSTAHHPEGVLIVPSNFEIWVIGEDDEVFEYRVASEADLDCPAGPSASPTSAAPTKFPTPAAATLCDTSGMAATAFWGTTVSECPGSSPSVCVAYEKRNYDGGFGATCDGFCAVYNLVCSAAHHDSNNGCAISSTLQCDDPGSVATSDHICTCEEAAAAPVAPTPAPTDGAAVAACGCDQVVLLKIDGAGDPADTITLYNMGADPCAPTDVFWIDDLGSAASGKTWSLTEGLAPGANVFAKGAANSFTFGISSTKDTVRLLTSCGSTSSLVIDDSLGTGSQVTSILDCGCDAVTLQSINGKNPDTITLFGSVIECRLDASNGWKIDDSGSAASGKTWSFAEVTLKPGSNTFTKNEASSFAFGISSTSDTVTLTTPCGTTSSLSVTSGSGGTASASNAETLAFPGCKIDCTKDTSAHATTPPADSDASSDSKEVLTILLIIASAVVAVALALFLAPPAMAMAVYFVCAGYKPSMIAAQGNSSSGNVTGKESGPPKPVKPTGIHLPGIALTRLERPSEIV